MSVDPDYPLDIQPLLDEKTIDEWENNNDGLGNPRCIRELNDLSEDEFKEIKKFAQSFFSKDKFDEVEKAYNSKTITKAQYVLFKEVIVDK